MLLREGQNPPRPRRSSRCNGKPSFRGPRSRRRAQPLRHPGGCRNSDSDRFLGIAPLQTPSAALLGCADASAVGTGLPSRPTTSSRCAWRGNVLDGASVGSIDFAVTNLPTLRAIAVVGHTGCGAARRLWTALSHCQLCRPVGEPSAAAFVDTVTPAVRAADMVRCALQGQAWSTGPASPTLLDASVVLNTAIAGDAVRQFSPITFTRASGRLQGLLPASRLVGLPNQRRMAPGPSSPPGRMNRPGIPGASRPTSVYIRRLLEV